MEKSIEEKKLIQKLREEENIIANIQYLLRYHRIQLQYFQEECIRKRTELMERDDLNFAEYVAKRDNIVMIYNERRLEVLQETIDLEKLYYQKTNYKGISVTELKLSAKRMNSVLMTKNQK